MIKKTRLINFKEEGNIVVKSEVIVKARYKLNPLSLKFITTLIAGLKRSDDINQVYQLRVKDFKELTGLKRKDLYFAVKEAIKELLEKPLYIPKGKNRDDNSFLMLNWVASGEYKEGEGLIEFEISSKLRPFLLEVKEKFLKYDLKNILNLKSSYSIRLYEILKDKFNETTRQKRKKEHIEKVNDLRKMLEIPQSYRYNDIKRFIIKRAQKELKEHTDIVFDFEEIKTGRKVTHIKFIIKENPKNTKPIELNQNKPEPKQNSEANDFKHFREKIIAKVDENKIILLGDDVYKIKNGLLYLNDEFLQREDAFTHWKKLYENRDKITIKSVDDIKKETFNEMEKELNKIYKGKKTFISVKGNYINAIVDKIELTKDDKIKVFFKAEDGKKYAIKYNNPESLKNL